MADYYTVQQPAQREGHGDHNSRAGEGWIASTDRQEWSNLLLIKARVSVASGQRYIWEYDPGAQFFRKCEIARPKAILSIVPSGRGVGRFASPCHRAGKHEGRQRQE